MKNTDQFFDVVSGHYNFLSVHLLLVLVLQFLYPSEIQEQLESYEETIDFFKENTKIRSLHKRLEPWMTHSTGEVPVTIRVQNAWGEHNMWLVEMLLKTLFRLESLKWLKVVPGSLIITILVPQYLAQSIIEHEYTKHNIQFMKLMGIMSLQVGQTYVMLQDEQNVNYSFEESLINATEVGNFEAVEFLLQQVQVDINTQTTVSKESENTVKEEATRVYTDLNGNMYFKRDSGTTALMTACCIHETGLVELHTQNKAKVDLQTNTGWTALMYAAVLGSSKIVEMLLKYNAEVNIKSFSSGKTALTFACMSGNAQVVNMLIKKSADVNAKDYNGVTPLTAVCKNGHLSIVEMLHRAKADPNISENNGVTPLYIASLNGNLPIVEQLLLMKAEHNTPCEKR